MRVRAQCALGLSQSRVIPEPVLQRVVLGRCGHDMLLRGQSMVRSRVVSRQALARRNIGVGALHPTTASVKRLRVNSGLGPVALSSETEDSNAE